MFCDKGLLICSSICALCVCVLIPFLNIHIHYPNFLIQAKTETCPFCYGKNMCQCFVGDNFHINWDHFWANLLNLCYMKRFYFGRCKDNLVVVKKFTKPQTYQSMGASFLNRDNISIPTIMREVENVLSQNNFHEPFNKFHFCPTFEKLRLFFELSIANKSLKPRNLQELYFSFYHMVQIDVGPLVQQIAKTNDWAVSEFLGSCGELTVSQYCGNTLTWAVPSMNWTQRSAIAEQLLIFAFNITLQHPNFAVYFTDMTPDNFAVSSEGIVRFVDLEHVIVVDKYPRECTKCGKVFTTEHSRRHHERFNCSTLREEPLTAVTYATARSDGVTNAQLPPTSMDTEPGHGHASQPSSPQPRPSHAPQPSQQGASPQAEHSTTPISPTQDQPDNWEINYECYHDASGHGFTFNPHEICSHQISDVNVYAICQGILSEHSDLLTNGLLHSPPQEVVGIKRLVEDCVSPPLGQSRFQIAKLLIQKLGSR